jgi:uncharacterized protein with NRDE domain
MCTVVILNRRGHNWPLLLAANRDEMADRPSRPPARHWSDRPRVIAGLDELGRGTWLGLNDFGVVAAVLNRLNTLGPAPGLRSRGELPLEALDNAEARVAAEAIADIDPHAYRPFNMIIADRREAFWVRARRGGNGSSAGGTVEVSELPPGLSMITAYDRNDTNSPRIYKYLPRFEAAMAPDPATGDWSKWKDLLASREHDQGAGPGGAICVATDTGFGTVSSSLIALPADGLSDAKPVWLFAPGNPGENSYAPVCM